MSRQQYMRWPALEVYALLRSDALLCCDVSPFPSSLYLHKPYDMLNAEGMAHHLVCYSSRMKDADGALMWDHPLSAGEDEQCYAFLTRGQLLASPLLWDFVA